jgi:hypothetical protein
MSRADWYDRIVNPPKKVKKVKATEKPLRTIFDGHAAELSPGDILCDKIIESDCKVSKITMGSEKRKKPLHFIIGITNEVADIMIRLKSEPIGYSYFFNANDRVSVTIDDSGEPAKGVWLKVEGY